MIDSFNVKTQQLSLNIEGVNYQTQTPSLNIECIIINIAIQIVNMLTIKSNISEFPLAPNTSQIKKANPVRISPISFLIKPIIDHHRSSSFNLIFYFKASTIA